MKTSLRWSACAALVVACNVGSDLNSDTSRIRLRLTDAPGPDIESAVVWISRAYLVSGGDSTSDSTSTDSSSRVVVTDEPQEYDLQPGQAVFLPAQTHSASNPGKSVVKLVVFEIKGAAPAAGGDEPAGDIEN